MSTSASSSSLEECQKSDWPAHKKVCTSLAAAQANAEKNGSVEDSTGEVVKEETKPETPKPKEAKSEEDKRTKDEVKKVSSPQTVKKQNENGNGTASIVEPIKSQSSDPVVEIDGSEEILNRGLELYRTGDYESSFSELSTGVQRYPSNYKLFEARSMSAMLTGRLEEAEKDALRAVELDPKSLKAKVRLLKVLVRKGALERAIALAEDIMKIDPTNASVRSDLQAAKLNARRLEVARGALAEGKYKEASALTQKVTEESPGCREALLLRAGCLMAMGELDDAYVLTTRVLRTDEASGTRDHGLLNLRAKILFEQERFDQCMKHLQEVLRENPDDSAAARLLKRVKKIQRLKTEGDDAFKAGKYQDSLESYSACLAETENTSLKQFRSKLFSNRAAAYSSLAKFEEAIADCDKAIELDPAYVKAYSRRAQCLRNLGGKERLERAVFDYEKVEELQGGATTESRENIRKAKQELKLAKRKNYYALLGITNNESAYTTEDIKKAYKRAALKYHPDRHTNSTDEEKTQAEAMFKDVAEALMVLSDPEKRRLYDRGMDLEEIEQRTAHGGHGGHGGHHHHGGAHFDPNMFARGGFGGFGGGFPGGFYDESDGYPF